MQLADDDDSLMDDSILQKACEEFCDDDFENGGPRAAGLPRKFEKRDVDVRKTLGQVAQEYERLQIENGQLRQLLHGSLKHNKHYEGKYGSDLTSSLSRQYSNDSSADDIPDDLPRGNGSSMRQRVSEFHVATGSLFTMPPDIFEDLEGMKSTVHSFLRKDHAFKIEFLYKPSGISQWICRNWLFEPVVIAIIVLNAGFIWIDTDLNDKEILLDAHPFFIVCEQLFCAFFTFEVFFRFTAFQRKRDAFRDPWFPFDLVLVFLMVAETWGLTLALLITGSGSSADFGDSSLLRLARLLRLCKMLRVARLLRELPELFILIKAIMSASRATFFTLLLLFVILYMYAVLFTQVLKDTDVGERYFATVLMSLQSLFYHVILNDDIAEVADSVNKEGAFPGIALLSIVLVGSITVMNILVGVLVEAISAIAETERTSMQVAMLETVLMNILEIDVDDQDEPMITKDDLSKVVGSQKAVQALDHLGIDVVALLESADNIFDSSTAGDRSDYCRVLSFKELMDVLIQMRGSNKATVRDIVELKRFTNKVFKQVEKLRVQVSHTHADVVEVQGLMQSSVDPTSSPDGLN